MTWSFLHPGRLWLLLALIGFVAVYIWTLLRRRKYIVRFSSNRLIDQIAPRRPGLGRHITAVMFLIGLAIGTLGVAQPFKNERIPKQRATIILAMDTSLSMKATDVSPSRIEASKNAAKTFVGSLPPALNLGLVSFDTGARVDVEPTTDRSRVKQSIDKLKLRQGTAIGDAVQSSLDLIAEVPKGEDGKAVPAVIVLLSDGSTTVGTPTEDAIPLARKAGVPVWTIAFGTPDGVISVQDPSSGENVTVSVPVDAEALAKLASGTGGDSFLAQSAEDLSAVYSKLGSSIGYEVERREVTFRYFVAALSVLALSGLASLLFFQRIP